MIGRALLFSLLFATAGLRADSIRYELLTTHDTGARLLNGQWRIGSRARMTYIDGRGNVASTGWRTQHWINDTSGNLLVATGWQQFTNSRFDSTVEEFAQFSTCYRGRAVALAGGATMDVGGPELCTAPPPAYGPSDCDIRMTAWECGFDRTCPILINMTSGPWSLSGAGDPVRFDLDADGTAEALSWTAADSSIAFLAHDRNGNGTIDDGTELFGNATAVHGFEALQRLDTTGDAILDSRDIAWTSLLLWNDRNRDAISQPAELTSVAASTLLALDLRHHRTAREDEHGNTFRLEAVATFARGTRPYYDVYFVRPR